MKKILFILSSEPDYLQDLTYSGLVKVLGINQICDYPWNFHYHIPQRKYPRNMGFTKPGFLKKVTYKKDFSDIGLVLIGSCKPETFQNYLKIIDKIPVHVPVIFIDGGDFKEIGGDMKRLDGWHLYEQAVAIRKFDMVFKREYWIDEILADNVFPLPFSFNPDFAVKKKESLLYDVTFWAVESHPIRTQALTLIENKFDCQENGTTRNQVFSKYKRKGLKYLQELSRAKISLNFQGVGWDTMRYWEVPYVGSLMITPAPKIYIPDNFRNKQEVVFCKEDLSDLIELCEYYLKNEEERKEIAKNAQMYAQMYHTHSQRAIYLLQTIQKFMNTPAFEYQIG